MSHQITICTSCRHKGTTCRPGYDLIRRLQRVIALAGDTVSETFAVSGVACMAACDHPCTVAYHATKKATYLFGDIDPETDVDDLVAFARQYSALEDGWTSSPDRPGKLRTNTLARVPAAMIAIEKTKARAS
ncbi:MAG: DUF1636 domain-containing protein [Pseudomonadota bacterium]